MKVIKFLCPHAFAFLFLLSPEAVGGVCWHALLSGHFWTNVIGEVTQLSKLSLCEHQKPLQYEDVTGNYEKRHLRSLFHVIYTPLNVFTYIFHYMTAMKYNFHLYCKTEKLPSQTWLHPNILDRFHTLLRHEEISHAQFWQNSPFYCFLAGMKGSLPCEPLCFRVLHSASLAGKVGSRKSRDLTGLLSWLCHLCL